MVDERYIEKFNGSRAAPSRYIVWNKLIRGCYDCGCVVEQERSSIRITIVLSRLLRLTSDRLGSTYNLEVASH